MRKIKSLYMNKQTYLENKDIKFEISKSAKKYILEKGTDLKYGARPLRRSIQRYILLLNYRKLLFHQLYLKTLV